MHEMETLIETNEGALSIRGKVLEELDNLKAQKKIIDNAIKKITDKINSELKERLNETTKIGDYNFVVKGGTYGVEFDMDLFIKNNFELYLKYLKPCEEKTSYAFVKATKEKQ